MEVKDLTTRPDLFAPGEKNTSNKWTGGWWAHNQFGRSWE